MIPIAIGASIILGMVLGAVFVIGFQGPKPHAESKLANLEALAMAAVESKNHDAGKRVKAEMEQEMIRMGGTAPMGTQVTYTALNRFLAHKH